MRGYIALWAVKDRQPCPGRLAQHQADDQQLVTSGTGVGRTGLPKGPPQGPPSALKGRETRSLASHRASGHPKCLWRFWNL